MGLFHQSLTDAKKKIEKNDFDGALEIVANHFHGREKDALKNLGKLKDEINNYFLALEQYLRTESLHSHYTKEARIREKKELLKDLILAEKHIKEVERLLREISADAKLEE